MRIHHPSSATGLVAAVLVMVAATGCTPEAAAPDSVASTVDRVSAEPDPRGVETEQATARLPEGFPADFPLPPDFTITEGRFTEGDFATQANFLVRGTSASSVADIAAFFQDRLGQAGYKVQPSQPIASDRTTAYVMFHSDSFKDCSVRLDGGNGATDVLISLPLRD